MEMSTQHKQLGHDAVCVPPVDAGRRWIAIWSLGLWWFEGESLLLTLCRIYISKHEFAG